MKKIGNINQENGKNGEKFLIGNGLETTHTCLYDIVNVTCKDSIYHCNLRRKPNFGPKQAHFRRTREPGNKCPNNAQNMA